MDMKLDTDGIFQVLNLCIPSAIERKSRYVTLPEFLDDNKPENVTQNCFDLVHFQLICQMLAKFSGVKSERTVFTLRKRKKKLCCVHLV